MSMRLVGLAFMVLAAVLAAIAAATVGWGRPDPGVAVVGGVGSRVEWVLPGGPSWSDGIRAGQSVLGISATVNQQSWRLVTADETFVYATSSEGHMAQLRAGIPAALMAVALGAIAWLAVRRLPLALALASLSALFSEQALNGSGQIVITSLAAPLAIAGPSLWLANWGPRPHRLRAIIVALAATVAVGWLVVRLTLPPLFEALELAREGTVAAGIVAMVVMLADFRRWRGRLLALDSVRVADLVAVVAILSLAVFVALAVELPPFVLIAAGASAALLYPRFRRRLATTIDQIVLGEVRDRASLNAIEEERGRIARDLHDEPLQEIAAVIRRLDGRPGTEAEAELLRQTAAHLRRLTTELRPPVLDDLGLRAVIAHVVDQAARRAPEIDIQAAIRPETPLGDRPPAEVELAIFRIAQEAVENAVEHSRARAIHVGAHVTESKVDLRIEDDGIGIADGTAREAVRTGHVGLASMAQRAALVGASFRVEGAKPHGTVVTVHWRAST